LTDQLRTGSTGAELFVVCKFPLGMYWTYISAG